MIHDNKIVQFIKLPELTNGIHVSGDAVYTVDRLNKIQELVGCRVEVNGDIAVIANEPNFACRLFFTTNNGIVHNKIYKWIGNDSLYIYSDAIVDFINEQLSTDSNTLFIPWVCKEVANGI